jgi:hypothetical protein
MVGQVEVSERTPLLSLLLVGEPGSGKSAITAKVRECVFVCDIHLCFVCVSAHGCA